jgi:L-iditol 2-dehydrogenase
VRNQAAVLHGIREIRLEERPVPEPGPREVLVDVRAVGVCGSDVHYYEHGRIGSFVVHEPLILGHETSGVVAAVGAEVTKHKSGERVALEPGIPCGRCRECRAGRYNLCPDVRFFATPPIDGTFQNYVTIHEDFAFTLPGEISDDAGALIEPLSVGIWACRKANVRAGAHVLVTGAGPVGLLAMQAVAAHGAAQLTITDVNPHRLEMARRLGATRAINVADVPLAEAGVQADALLECSGHPSALADGIRSLGPAGVAVAVGMAPGETATVPLAVIQSREIVLTGVFRYANTYADAIALVAAGRISLDAIVTGHFPLRDVERALLATKADSKSIKAIVAPGLAA